MKVDISIAFVTNTPIPPEAVVEFVVHGDFREVMASEARSTGHQLAQGEHVYRFSRLAQVSTTQLGVDQMLHSIDRILEDNGVKPDVIVERLFANVVQR